MDVFSKSFTHTLGLEGKYSNNPNDTGGETMWGITKALCFQQGFVFFYVFQDGTHVRISHDTIPTINTDIHIAIVRHSNVLTL